MDTKHVLLLFQMADTVKKSRIVSDDDENLEEALLEEFNMRLKSMSEVCIFFVVLMRHTFLRSIINFILLNRRCSLR